MVNVAYDIDFASRKGYVGVHFQLTCASKSNCVNSEYNWYVPTPCRLHLQCPSSLNVHAKVLATASAVSRANMTTSDWLRPFDFDKVFWSRSSNAKVSKSAGSSEEGEMEARGEDFMTTQNTVYEGLGERIVEDAVNVSQCPVSSIQYPRFILKVRGKVMHALYIRDFEACGLVSRRAMLWCSRINNMLRNMLAPSVRGLLHGYALGC